MADQTTWPFGNSQGSALAQYRELIEARPSLLKQIEEAQATLAQVDRRITELSARIESALSTRATIDVLPPPPAGATVPRKRRRGGRPASGPGGLARWETALRAIGRAGGQATNRQVYDAIPKKPTQTGTKHEDAARSLLSTILGKRGLIVSNGAGTWKLTDAGRQEYERLEREKAA